MKQINETSFGVIPLKLIKNDWQIFLIQHKNGNHWSFPKGHVHPKEDPKQAALRELKEETNLNPKRFLSEKPLKETYQFYRNKQEVHKTVFYYLVEVQGKEQLQKEEVLDGKWYSFIEAHDKITYDESRFILSAVLELIRKIHPEN